MKYAFIHEHRSVYRVEKMCRVLGVSRSGYSAWRRRGRTDRDESDERLVAQIRRIFIRRREVYGSPRITEELHDNGVRCGKNRVARLMREYGMVAKARRRFKVTTNSRHQLPVAPNLLEQQFHAEAPNRIWASDITYIHTGEGWLYLAVVLDVYSRQIVGCAMGRHITSQLVIDAVTGAVERRKPGRGVIFHSDRGSQYASNEFRSVLAQGGFVQSMSGKGNCYDNAIVETFFHTLKTELVYFEKYRTRAEAQKSIFEYIWIFYNHVRRHSSLEYLSPADYERYASVS